MCAWTTPRTWVVGETVTAALFNTHIRDNSIDLDSRMDALDGAVILAGTDTSEDSTTATVTEGALNSVTGLSIPATSGIRVVLPFRKSTGAAASVQSLSIELNASDGSVNATTLSDAANSAGSGVAIIEFAPYDADYGSVIGWSYFRNAAGTETNKNWSRTSPRDNATVSSVNAAGTVSSASITLYTQNMKVYELP